MWTCKSHTVAITPYHFHNLSNQDTFSIVVFQIYRRHTIYYNTVDSFCLFAFLAVCELSPQKNMYPH